MAMDLQNAAATWQLLEAAANSALRLFGKSDCFRFCSTGRQDTSLPPRSLPSKRIVCTGQGQPSSVRAMASPERGGLPGAAHGRAAAAAVMAIRPCWPGGKFTIHRGPFTMGRSPFAVRLAAMLAGRQAAASCFYVRALQPRGNVRRPSVPSRSRGTLVDSWLCHNVGVAGVWVVMAIPSGVCCGKWPGEVHWPYQSKEPNSCGLL